jgi:hypothetical protein
MEDLLLAFVLGTALCAAAGTLVEAVFRIPARLDRPFVDAERVLFSLVRIMFAGAYFLVAEAAEARTDGRCGFLLWGAAILFAAVWCLCLGIVSLALTLQVFDLSMAAFTTGVGLYELL